MLVRLTKKLSPKEAVVAISIGEEGKDFTLMWGGRSGWRSGGVYRYRPVLPHLNHCTALYLIEMDKLDCWLFEEIEG